MDERIRALEHATLVDPSDVAASLALIRAYDAAGDAVAAWRERCRLERRGDPAVGARAAPSVRGVRSAPRVAASRALGALASTAACGQALIVFDRSPPPRGADPEPTELLCLDPATLRLRWCRPASAVRGARASGPLLALPDSQRITIHDVRHGVVVDTVPFADEPTHVDCAWWDADRFVLAVVHLGSTQFGARVVDLRSPAPAVARIALGADSLRACAGALVCRDDAAREVYALGYDGAPRWRVAAADVVASDRADVLLTSVTLTPWETAVGELWAVDPASGETRWRRERRFVERAGPIRLTPALLVHVTSWDPNRRAGDEAWETLHVSAFARATGEPVWEHVEVFGPHLTLHVALSDDTVYVVAAKVDPNGTRARGLRLLAFDLASGAPLFRHPIDLPRDERMPPPAVRVFPFDRRLAVFAREHDAARIDLLEAG